MQDLLGKVNYLYGLADGLGVNENTHEGKVLVGILDVLEDLIEEIEDLNEGFYELDEYVESMDEDLYDLETEVYCLDEDEIEIECPTCHQDLFLDDCCDSLCDCEECEEVILEEEE